MTSCAAALGTSGLHSASAAASDTIADFQDGFDKLDFSRLPAIGSAADLAIESVSTTVTVVRFFDGIEDVELTITGTAPTVLDHADFLFGAA